MENIVIKSLNELKEQGYASYTELKEAGIRKVFNLGKNEWGFNERVIIDNNYDQWNYIPEDEIYEFSNEVKDKYLNQL